jgi:CO/xanthine dehydrogenase Mo-binding subunit
MSRKKETTTEQPKEQFAISHGSALQIGLSVPRCDAYDKVLGQEKYAADYYGSDLVWAGVKRAGVPHATLREIHTADAKELPGVLCVLTCKDISGSNRQGVVRRDQPVLVDDKIRYCGDAVALVLAEDRATLKAAIGLIKVDYDPLPGVFSIEEAMAHGAPLIHEENSGGNVLLVADLESGNGLSAFEQCHVVVERDFQTSRQEHAYLETEVGWARAESDGKLVIVSSTQTPFRDRTEVAEALGLEPTRIRMIAPYAGGAFGGKDGVTVQSLLALAALHSNGRPVKMWWEREESFAAGTKRHATSCHYRLGAKADGELHALEAHLYFDTGAYDHLGGVVLTLALEHAGGPYRIPNVSLKGRCVYTNNPIGGAFRAFGVTQVTAAIEQMMDILAGRLGMDPMVLRLKNAVRRGDKNAVGVTLTGSTGILECLESLSEHPLWRKHSEWKRSAGRFKRRGVGMAALMHASGYGPVVPDYANAKVELTLEGKIRVYCGVVDMGQGNAATTLQIAGSILCQEAHQMELVLPDTERTLPSGSASASRCTYTFGNALIGAAQTLKERILQKAADLMMAGSVHEVAILPGMIRHLETGREVSLSRMAHFMADSERVAVHHFRASTAKAAIRGVTDDLRLHGLGHGLVSFAAHLAYVEVDEITGSVEVKKYLAISDCGAVMNPQIFEQQIQGGMAQGLGFALFEDFRVERGAVQTRDFSTYILPTAQDVPDVESIAVEIHEPSGPFGLKGVGEITTNGPLPAVANAVAEACGIRLFRAPMTPDLILDAMTRHRKELETE